MKKFIITYNEGNVTNKTVEISADNYVHALMIFSLDFPDADYTKVQEA